MDEFERTDEKAAAEEPKPTVSDDGQVSEERVPDAGTGEPEPIRRMREQFEARGYDVRTEEISDEETLAKMFAGSIIGSLFGQSKSQDGRGGSPLEGLLAAMRGAGSKLNGDRIVMLDDCDRLGGKWMDLGFGRHDDADSGFVHVTSDELMKLLWLLAIRQLKHQVEAGELDAEVAVKAYVALFGGTELNAFVTMARPVPKSRR